MQNKMQNKFLLDTTLITPHSTLIIGLSGGPDSVCLLDQLVKLKEKLSLTLIAVHVNHEWRTCAIKDQLLCQELCRIVQVPCIIKKVSELPSIDLPHGSQEERGRILRRYIFETVARDYQAQAIVLAHHQDDQLETFFIRLIRGSTITGLTGIQKQSGLYI